MKNNYPEGLYVKAYGKVNLGLDVLRRREDGYHDLRMIMQTVDLYDIITITCCDEEVITLTCNREEVPCNEHNLIYKSAMLMKQTYGIQGGFHIALNKQIPMAAGMAGGSADAAATFRGINTILDLDLSLKELCALGVKIGADVPYCIMGGTYLAEGIGEILTKLPSITNYPVLIAKPDFDVSTGYVYQNLSLNEETKHPDITQMTEAIRSDDMKTVINCMGNVLETVTEVKFPAITGLKQEMIAYGAQNSLMSGSGPTVFGLFSTMKECENAALELKEQHPTYNVFATVLSEP